MITDIFFIEEGRIRENFILGQWREEEAMALHSVDLAEYEEGDEMSTDDEEYEKEFIDDSGVSIEDGDSNWSTPEEWRGISWKDFDNDGRVYTNSSRVEW